MARPKKIHLDPDQPDWICYTCGMKYGSFKCGQVTWHHDNCGCCGEWKACTDPRDFGYLLLGWKEVLNGRYDDEAIVD